MHGISVYYIHILIISVVNVLLLLPMKNQKCNSFLNLIRDPSFALFLVLMPDYHQIRPCFLSSSSPHSSFELHIFPHKFNLNINICVCIKKKNVWRASKLIRYSSVQNEEVQCNFDFYCHRISFIFEIGDGSSVC